MLPAKVAAERLGVTSNTLRAWRFRRRGPPFVQASERIVLYSELALEAWLAGRVVSTSL